MEVIIKGQRASAQLAGCCHPVQGDSICVFERAGHGITVHRASCKHAQLGKINDATRWEDAIWGNNQNQQFNVPIDLKVSDVRKGIYETTQTVAQEGATIVGLNIPDDLNDPELQLLIQVDNRIQLMRVIRALNQIPNIKEVKRKFESSY